jgi:hypothetical protein
MGWQSSSSRSGSATGGEAVKSLDRLQSLLDALATVAAQAPRIASPA